MSCEAATWITGILLFSLGMFFGIWIEHDERRDA